MLGLVTGYRRTVRAVAWVTAATLAVEMVIVVLQVVRGTTSHFNISTPFNAALFAVMGMLIMVLWLTTVVAAGLLLRQRLADQTLAWGIRLGLITAVVGMGLAFLMTSPTAAQLASYSTAQPSLLAGAHSVGVDDGGPGLPVVGWSTAGGDLRVAHFVGLHAMQVLPLVGWWLARRSRLRPRQRLALMFVAGAGYLALVALLTWQALRGQPVLAPDALTLAAGGATLAVLGAAVLAALAWPARAGAGQRLAQ